MGEMHRINPHGSLAHYYNHIIAQEKRDLFRSNMKRARLSARKDSHFLPEYIPATIPEERKSSLKKSPVI